MWRSMLVRCEDKDDRQILFEGGEEYDVFSKAHFAGTQLKLNIINEMLISTR